MSSAHETAYPRLQSELTDKELQDIYTPTPVEYALAISIRKPAPRLGFLLHLKLFQRLGYFTRLDTAPIQMRFKVKCNWWLKFHCNFTIEKSRISGIGHSKRTYLIEEVSNEK